MDDVQRAIEQPEPKKRKWVEPKMKVIDMADLLTELKQYRATGLTPDQLKEIDKLYQEQCRELYQYRQIGATGECREAREKQHPKKVLVRMTKETSRCSCGSCRSRVESYHKYCPFCGQAIDWNREEVSQ